MHTLGRHRLLLPVLAAALTGAGCGSPSPVTVPVPEEVGAGILQATSLATLQAHGWRVCFEDRYADSGASVSTVLSACGGPYLMLACRADAASDALALAAADLREVVTRADPAETTAAHVSHGVGWYYTDSLSWGFYPASDTVNRANCDLDTGAQTSKEKRLCWNVLDGVLLGGWRCGDNVLGTGSAYRRLVLTHP